MNLEYRLLTDVEVAVGLSQLRDWKVSNGMLTKEFTFGNFKDALLFANMVGYTAEALDHHPDLTVKWGKVTVSVNTHSVNGLSPYDLEFARRVDVVS